MKTRAKKASTTKSDGATETDKPKTQTLEPSVSNPPQVFILPKDTSPACRIITLPNPATATPSRLLVCPEKGFYEFTRVAAPKRACRSWLLAPEHDATAANNEEEGVDGDEAYVLQTPDLMIATPIDPLFVVLSALAHGDEAAGKQTYLTASDYLERIGEQSDHFRQVMRSEGSEKLEKIFEARMAVVCDGMEAGDEKLYRLSRQKLLEELVGKAKRMVAKGLPASLEERFVKQALAVPVLSIKREESSLSIPEGDDATPGAESQTTATSASISQDTQASSTTTSSVSTTATSIATTPVEDRSVPTEEITHLLRLRTALNFLLSSYIPPTLRAELSALPTTNVIGFTPLDTHLRHLEKLKKEAQALRSLSENISRKRGIEDDEEALEKQEGKKRKKEEEEFRKKNMSRGVQQLAKANTSGMKKMNCTPCQSKTQQAHSRRTVKMASEKKIYAYIDYEDTYVQPLLLAALKARLPPELLVFINSLEELPSPSSRLLQWRQYESIDFDHLTTHPRSSLANSYIIRKALIRKHYLSNTVTHWTAKNPSSILRHHVKPSVEFEVDYAEFLDDALVEAWELKESWVRNEAVEASESGALEWWILKPGMSERGQGIRLFCSEEQLQSIFDEWDPADSDDEEEESSADAASAENGVMTSHLRHFIAQPYIHPPLLLAPPHRAAARKFHIRTYVLAAGALKVYLYKRMLALFAANAYSPPSVTANEDLAMHLTNTCLQSTGEREGSVHEFRGLPAEVPGLSGNWKGDVFLQICVITADIFEAAARSMSVHFQPLPNAFEIFGLDFLVDAEGKAWLLEVNAFPDFRQTGDELQGLIGEFVEGVVDVAVAPFFGGSKTDGKRDDMVEVLDIDLGRR
ncbi:hypothetical protein LTR37_010634 [Vermiconidia calcicola]|uniref:Uncharacterized protein n=1 Tax=Vermiconidia calcicola TaxID=1690605 RepID=A0ACC3N4F9_9PEZI|nr:hypothetical protein LTR37_010634 [Vermiconidia calcicola]